MAKSVRSTGKSHSLKCWPEYFSALWDGRKTMELRRNDRGYSVGDVLLVREYDPGLPLGDCQKGCPLRHAHAWAVEPAFSGRELTAQVTHLLPGGRHGLEEGYVIMSLLRMQRAGASARLKVQEQ